MAILAKRQLSDRVEALIRALHARMPELQQRYGVCELWAFGSYVRGEERPTSDFDLLVAFDDRPLSLLKFIKLENYLSDLLGVRVDLVEKEGLKPAIGRRILEEVVPI